MCTLTRRGRSAMQSISMFAILPRRIGRAAKSRARSHATIYDQVLGFDEPQLIAAFREAVASKSYDKVRRAPAEPGGEATVERAHALLDHREYFAEASEAFFGQNDYFPFNREELRQHDPKLYSLLWRLWAQPAPSGER